MLSFKRPGEGERRGCRAFSPTRRRASTARARSQRHAKSAEQREAVPPRGAAGAAREAAGAAGSQRRVCSRSQKRTGLFQCRFARQRVLREVRIAQQESSKGLQEGLSSHSMPSSSKMQRCSRPSPMLQAVSGKGGRQDRAGRLQSMAVRTFHGPSRHTALQPPQRTYRMPQRPRRGAAGGLPCRAYPRWR